MSRSGSKTTRELLHDIDLRLARLEQRVDDFLARKSVIVSAAVAVSIVLVEIVAKKFWGLG